MAIRGIHLTIGGIISALSLAGAAASAYSDMNGNIASLVEFRANQKAANMTMEQEIRQTRSELNGRLDTIIAILNDHRK